MGNKVKFTVECEMEERWINQFMSFLNMLESNGSIGHSSSIAFYADGDGDFHPHFKTNISFNKEQPAHNYYKDGFSDTDINIPLPECMYDAG